MKKSLLSLFLLGSVLALGACGTKSSSAANLSEFGYGDAVDGIEKTGTWSYKDNILESSTQDADSKIFKDEFKQDFSLSCTVKLNSFDENHKSKSGIGGYVYYEDENNNVKFSFKTTTNIVKLESTKGMDSQPITAYYPTKFDIKNGIDVVVTKRADLFELYIDDKLITSVREQYDNQGQYGFFTNYATGEFNNISFNNLGQFESKDIENDIYTPAASMPGTWEIDGAIVNRTDTDPSTANFESVVFNSATATNYKLKSTIKKIETIPDGWNLYGVVCYYRNASNYIITFFKDNFVDVYIIVNGAAKWTKGVDVPNPTADFSYILECEKVGPKTNIYVNGVHIRTIIAESFNFPGSVGFDTNGAAADFEMVELKTINEFSNVNYDDSIMSYCNVEGGLEQTGRGYTSVDSVKTVGEQYDDMLYTESLIYGNQYEYEVNISTTNLTGNDENSIGIYNTSDSAQCGLLVRGNGKVDLYGSFRYSDSSGEQKDVPGTYAGIEKDVPASCKDGANFKEVITVKIVYESDHLTFYVGEEIMFDITIKSFGVASPGIATNYVGASFLL